MDENVLKMLNRNGSGVHGPVHMATIISLKGSVGLRDGDGKREQPDLWSVKYCKYL